MVVGVPAVAPVTAAADDAFTVCPSGLSGVATPDTSCGFADSVRAAFYAQVGWTVFAHSPATGLVYTMQCREAWTSTGWVYPKRCFGLNSSGVPLVVYIS